MSETMLDHDLDDSTSSGRRSSGLRTGFTRQRIRMLYFSLASLWGYLVAAAAVLAAVAAKGGTPGTSPLVLALLGGGGVLAVVGGLVTSAAYRDASRKHR